MIDKKKNLDSIKGTNYEFQFIKDEDGRKVTVLVNEIESNYSSGGTQSNKVQKVGIDSRSLPLSRQEAESLVQKYLSDLHPDRIEQTIYNLCIEASDGLS